MFKFDPEYAEHEAQYAAISRELLGEESSSEEEGGSGEGGDGSSSEEESEEEGGGAPGGAGGWPGVEFSHLHPNLCMHAGCCPPPTTC